MPPLIDRNSGLAVVGGITLVAGVFLPWVRLSSSFQFLYGHQVLIFGLGSLALGFAIIGTSILRQWTYVWILALVALALVTTVPIFYALAPDIGIPEFAVRSPDYGWLVSLLGACGSVVGGLKGWSLGRLEKIRNPAGNGP